MSETKGAGFEMMTVERLVDLIEHHGKAVAIPARLWPRCLDELSELDVDLHWDVTIQGKFAVIRKVPLVYGS